LQSRKNSKASGRATAERVGPGPNQTAPGPHGPIAQIWIFTLAHPYRVVLLALGTVALAGGDLMEIIPLFSPIVGTLPFQIFHQSHDVLALLLVLYAAYTWLPAVGLAALGLFVAVHLPYLAVTWNIEIPEHIRLIVTFAVASVAIRLISELRQLHSVQEEIAKTLQEALLVIPRDVKGLTFAHLYRSASRATRVGGDFLDLFELERGKVGLIIGDISGKGLPAATLTARVKNTIRAYAESGDPPALAMTKTNEVMRKTFSRNVFVTAFLGILDTTSGRLVYCSAGHPPALLKKRSGPVSALQVASPLMGAFHGFVYADGEETLRDGDLLILYTDGIIESGMGRERFGEERLRRFVASLSPGTVPEKVPQAILDETSRFSGGMPSDDIAVLVVSLRQKEPESRGLAVASPG